MGQGTLTGLAQLVAEELECDWSKVTTEYPTPGQSVARKRAWGDFSTGGSRGIRTSQDYVRKGGASAAMMLVQAAANEWKVPASECTAAHSVITPTPSGRPTTYGKVVEAAAKLEPPTEVKLKDPKDWKIAGKALKRLDTPDKTTGKMIYGIDIKLPGMLNAAIKDCPVFGGKLKSFDEAKVMDMKGVKKVVKVNDHAVAVVADTWWHAKTALDALPIVWDEGDNAKVSSASITKWLEEGLDSAQPAFIGNQNGDAKAAVASAARKVEAVYNYPYQNHATMEPLNATALYTADKCEGWCGTQNGEAGFAATLEASGLPADKCEVHKQILGGGFGRRGQTDYVRQAVSIARQMPGTPIKLLWSREEDMQHGMYHPVTQCKLTGAFDADNNLTALQIRLSGQSILFSLRPEALVHGMDTVAFQGLNATGEAAIGYSVPNLLVEHSMRNPHVPPGFWRGVNVNHNAIYLECFMDELAHSVGQDPVAFRRKLMTKHPKHLAVLNAVAEKIGWDKPAPQGGVRGIAQHMGSASYVARAAEIPVTDGTTSTSPSADAPSGGPQRPPLNFRIMLMDALRLMTRRNVVRGIAASAASSVFPCPSRAQSAAHIIVVGGGFGGASCARALKRIDPKMQVTLIEPNRTFTACPFSNEVIAGLPEIAAQQFSYDLIIAESLTVISHAAVKIDP